MSVRRTLMLSLVAVLVALPGSAFAAFQYPEAPPPPPVVPSVTTQPPIPQHETFGLVAPTYVPPGVSPTGVYTAPITPGSKGTTATYNLDWTIGTAGKSGCLVCHGDKNLVRIVAGIPVSMYVDTAELQSSAHAKLLCTDCHTDFAYKVPHPTTQAGEDWRTIAKSSCKNCHQPEFLDWAKSAHSLNASYAGTTTTTLGRPGSSAPGMPRPMCGDCHQGHSIPTADNTAAEAAIHASGVSMCGRCHVAWAANYNDYYHGAAYKRGAPDAPACWQCHNTHLIQPSTDKTAWTYTDNLMNTCSQCHKGEPSTGYVAYAPLIHQRQQVLQSNPIFSVVDTATTAIENMFKGVMSAFRRSGT
jgi:hypothetical protein